MKKGKSANEESCEISKANNHDFSSNPDKMLSSSHFLTPSQLHSPSFADFENISSIKPPQKSKVDPDLSLYVKRNAIEKVDIGIESIPQRKKPRVHGPSDIPPRHTHNYSGSGFILGDIIRSWIPPLIAFLRSQWRRIIRFITQLIDKILRRRKQEEEATKATKPTQPTREG